MAPASCSTCGKPVQCEECISEKAMQTLAVAPVRFDGITFERVGHHSAPVPRRGTQRSAGLDFTLPANVELSPGETRVVPCGFKIQLPEGFFGLMKPRSSAARLGIRVTGVIDEDFRGEIGLSMHNASNRMAYLTAGNRYAQMLVLPIFYLETREGRVERNTDRGEGGFGSTGI